jgi:hypothetical protein
MHWIAIVVLALIVFCAPAVVAQTVTSPSEPLSFLARPWTGWTFAGSVLVDSFSAKASSPGSALRAARRAFQPHAHAPGVATPDPQPRAVQLLYLPGSTKVTIETELGGKRRHERVDPPHPLVWLVLGRVGSDGSDSSIGLLDFTTGHLVWDVRSMESAA